jgi:lipopolysaccharide/colanic/teichoic acid biosynthesis glycosyltransferase
MGKRILDLALASLGLVLLFPLFLVIALLVKVESKGPVFFRQERVGRHGKLFRIFKFRTMHVADASSGALITVAGDSRITRVGAILRRTKLDETAQLIDVFRGTMSLVGPRPEVPRYVQLYPPAWRDRLLSVRPGITDFASVRYRDEGALLARAIDPERMYVESILPTKLKYSLEYVDNVSLGNDIRILGMTLRTVVSSPIPAPRRRIGMKELRLWQWLESSMSALRPRNRALAMATDGVVILLCWHLTYLFRLGFERWQPGRPWYDDLVSFGVASTYLIMLALAGVPRGLWRYFGFDDFRRIAIACGVAGGACALVVLMAQLSAVPRAVLLLHPLFTAFVLSMVRMSYRVVWEYAREQASGQQVEERRAIVLGAGEAGRRLVGAIHRRDGWTVLALLDDDPAKQGIRIGGVTVQGVVADLVQPHVLAGATHVIVALPGAPEPDRARVIEFARASGLPVMSVPPHVAPDAP